MPTSLPDMSGFLSQFSSPETKRTYECSLLQFDDFIKTKPESTDFASLANEFIDYRTGKVSPFTVAKDGMAIKSYLYYRGIDWRRKFRGLSRKLKPWLSKDQVATIIGYCKNPLEKALIVTLYDSALRIQELLNLQISDIHDGFLTVTRKGGSEGNVPISPNTVQCLEDYLKWKGKPREEGNRVFPYKYIEVLTMTRKIAKRSKIPFTPHKLRHARASNLRESGVEIADIMALLGHKRIDTTMIYAHVTADELKRRIPHGF